MVSGLAFNDRLLQQGLPSIFELFALERMSSTFRPALKYLLKVITNAFIPKFSLLTDELTLLVEGMVQGSILYHYDASIAEKIYDLKRVSSISGRSLAHFDRLKSLLFIIFIPYIKSKLDDIHGKLLEEDDLQPIVFDRNNFMKHAFFKCYPIIIAVFNIAKVVFQFLYLCKKSHVHSPMLFLLGITLVRDSNDQGRPLGIFQEFFSVLFPVILFGLKFTEWWYSPEKEDVTNKISSLPIPPPPSPLKAQTGIPESPYLCPICFNTRRNPVCIASSGFVYCYSCIYRALSERHECPISLIPATHSQLIRLFPQMLNS